MDGEQPPPILTAQGEGTTEVPSDSAWQRGLQVAQGRPSPGSEGWTLWAGISRPASQGLLREPRRVLPAGRFLWPCRPRAGLVVAL